MNRLMGELTAALEECEAGGRAIDIFFRDDDVDEDEKSLRRLLDLFVRRNVPLNLAVIPGCLTDSAVSYLVQTCSAHPELIELNQHGWRHVNHEPEGRQCEFGPSRTFDQQLSDIASGKAKMTSAFGDMWFPVFVPPWNRCTEETYQALDRLEFPVLSRNETGAPVTGHKFHEISISLDLYQWRGGAAMRQIEAILEDLILQIRQRKWTGVMLHHKVMSDEAFSFVDLLLDTLNQYRNIRYHTFRRLLELTP